MKNHSNTLNRLIQWFNKNTFFSILLIGIVILSITSFKATETAEATKVGVINLEYVVARSKPGIELQKRLEDFQQNTKLTGDRMNAEALAIRNQINEGANSLSQDKLAELQQQFNDKNIEIKRYMDDKQREGQKIQTDGLSEIETALEPIAKLLVEQGGVDLLINNVPGIVIMANPSIDLTDKMIALVNE